MCARRARARAGIFATAPAGDGGNEMKFLGAETNLNFLRRPPARPYGFSRAWFVFVFLGATDVFYETSRDIGGERLRVQ